MQDADVTSITSPEAIASQREESQRRGMYRELLGLQEWNRGYEVGLAVQDALIPPSHGTGLPSHGTGPPVMAPAPPQPRHRPPLATALVRLATWFRDTTWSLKVALFLISTCVFSYYISGLFESSNDMYQMTLNPMVNRKLHLDVAPSGFFRIEDTLQSQALSPLRNDLAFSASVLRSAGAAAADPISPHIGDRYRAIAEDIRFVLDLGYTRLKGLSDAQRKEDAALRMIMNETSRLLKTWCGEDTRHRFVRWIRPRHGCADISALAATDQMLELKGKLIGLASGGPHLPTTVGPHDDINTSLQKIDSALEAVSLAVSNFTHISQTLAFKDFIHRVTEFTIFNSFPVLGRLVRWSQTKLWTWITGSDDIAIRFLARAVMGHTAAVREDVAAARVRYNEWIEAYAATVKTSLEDELNLQGIGAGGQGLVDALRSILDAAQTIQRQRDREARMTRQYLRPLFKAGK